MRSPIIYVSIIMLGLTFSCQGAMAQSTFPNGVSSGDVDQDSAVLWARSTAAGKVKFRLYENNFRGAPVDKGTVLVTDTDLPAKYEFSNLKAGTRYVYKIKNTAGEHVDGSFTTPNDTGLTTGLRFGVTGDWRGELAPYPAIRNAADYGLDFFVKLGDTIYADVPTPAVDKPQAETLEDFRLKHAEVYSEQAGLNAWADLQAHTPIYAAIDDHEVTNDFAGGAPSSSDPRFIETEGLINQTSLFNNGLQAFTEYNAIEDLHLEAIGDPRTDGAPDLYRYRDFGNDAAFIMLDARSFRDEELPDVANPLDPAQVGAFLALSFGVDPATGQPLPYRTMLSQRQLGRLFSDLLYADQAGITWKFVMVPEPIQNLGVLAASDRFEGYAAERSAVLKFIDDNDIDNVVFVSADIHGTLINNLTYQLGPGFPQIPTNTFEVVTGSVAYDAPFGPTVLGLAASIPVAPGVSLLDVFLAGVGVPDLDTFYSLPGSIKNTALEALVNQQIVPLGYNAIGLQDTTGIDATLLEGGYTAVFSYGWTEFDIDADTQALTVTTYGIDPYTRQDVEADVLDVASREPVVVSKFVVMPQ
jgi:phosphodiesterase/alkaline phosphatase D-like protein